MRCAMKVFDEELKLYGIKLSVEERRKYALKIWKMLCCWRKSKYFDMLRPKTHVILLEKHGITYGVFAQPDFWDGNRVFMRLKVLI